MQKLLKLLTKANLHKLVTVIGVLFTVLSEVYIIFGNLGLTVEGKAAAALGMLTTLLAGWKRAAPKIDAAIDELPIPEKDKGCAAVGLMLWIAVTAMIVLAMGGYARAGGPGIGCFDVNNSYCVVPATAVGWQINLRDGSLTNGVLLAGLSLQHTFGSIPLGLGLYGGLGASTENQRSLQGCAGLSVTSWGMVCVGAQRATFSSGSSAWQGMLTFAGQLSLGAGPGYVHEVESTMGVPR